MIKRLLALIPRSIVHRVPRHVRDRWRTRLLALERRLQGRPRPVTGGPPPAPVRREFGRVTTHLRRLERRVEGIERRLDEVLAELGQLDSRISSHSSGEAPSPLDDLQRLVRPIEALNERLDRLERDDEAPTENTHVRAVGGDDA